MKVRLTVLYLLEVKGKLQLETTFGTEKSRVDEAKNHNRIMPEAGHGVEVSNVSVEKFRFVLCYKTQSCQSSCPRARCSTGCGEWGLGRGVSELGQNEVPLGRSIISGKSVTDIHHLLCTNNLRRTLESWWVCMTLKLTVNFQCIVVKRFPFILDCFQNYMVNTLKWCDIESRICCKSKQTNQKKKEGLLAKACVKRLIGLSGY